MNITSSEVEKLIHKHPNDADLGAALRQEYWSQNVYNNNNSYTPILLAAIDDYAKRNPLFDKKLFDSIQILEVVFDAMERVQTLTLTPYQEGDSIPPIPLNVD